RRRARAAGGDRSAVRAQRDPPPEPRSVVRGRSLRAVRARRRDREPLPLRRPAARQPLPSSTRTAARRAAVPATDLRLLHRLRPARSPGPAPPVRRRSRRPAASSRLNEKHCDSVLGRRRRGATGTSLAASASRSTPGSYSGGALHPREVRQRAAAALVGDLRAVPGAARAPHRTLPVLLLRRRRLL